MKKLLLLSLLAFLAITGCSKNEEPEPEPTLYCDFTSYSDIHFGGTASSSTELKIKSNSEWMLSVNEDGQSSWVYFKDGDNKVYKFSGSNDATVNLYVDDIDNFEEREATVSLTHKGQIVRKIKVIQDSETITAYIKFTDFLTSAADPTEVDIEFEDNTTLSGLNISEGIVDHQFIVGEKISSARFYIQGDGKRILVDWLDSIEGIMVADSDKGSLQEIPLPDFAGGDGSEEAPFLIANPRQFVKIDNLNLTNKKYYLKMIADLDLKESCTQPGAPFYYDGCGWAPVIFLFP